MNLSALKKESLPNDISANIGRNLLWLSWSGVVSIANSILIWIFMARMRETDELGRFTIVMGLYALFYSVCSLGLVPYLVSEISRRNAEIRKNVQTIAGFISTASVFLLISGMVCAVLMTAGGFLISESWTVRAALAILSFAMIPTALISVAESAAISFGRTRLIAFVTTLENVLRTVIPIALIWADYSIPVICLAFAAVRFAALAIYFLASRRLFSKFAFNAADFRVIAGVSPTFAGTIIFASINWQAAVILLGYISTETESAKFGVASRFLIPVSILMASYASVIQPVIAQYTQKSGAHSGSYLSKMASYPLILATIAAIVSPFLSRQVLTVLFGVDYADAAEVLDILTLSVVPFSLVMVVSRGLVATNAQHIDLLANALGVAACFSAGFLLIPQYGATGAAMAQLFSFLLMALLEIGYLSRKIVGFNVWRTASLSSACLLLVYMIFWKH